MKQQTFFFILYVLVLESCGIETSGPLKNLEIDPSTKQQIRTLNDKVFHGITIEDVGSIQAIMSARALSEDAAKMEKIITNAHASFKANSYRVLDEYHISNLTPGTLDTLASGTTWDDAYLLHFPVYSPETYISLMLPNGLESDFLITAIYGKYDEDWKLDILQFGQYGLFNKNASQYYAAAKEYYDEGKLVDALINMEMAQRILRPAERLWQYQKTQEFNAFDATLKKEFNTRFPLPFVLDNVEGTPRLFKIHAGVLSDGFHPMVSYLTSIPLDDEAALQSEYESVKSEVNHLFTGINQGKKYVFYRAYNELPAEEKKVDYFGFVDMGVK